MNKRERKKPSTQLLLLLLLLHAVSFEEIIVAADSLPFTAATAVSLSSVRTVGTTLFYMYICSFLSPV